jgi:hypothetical protein
MLNTGAITGVIENRSGSLPGLLSCGVAAGAARVGVDAGSAIDAGLETSVIASTAGELVIGRLEQAETNITEAKSSTDRERAFFNVLSCSGR